MSGPRDHTRACRDGEIDATCPCETPSALDPLPICLPCWRERFGLEEELPPPIQDWPHEECAVCRRETTAGLYLLRGPEHD